jgi:hypothetical protein
MITAKMVQHLDSVLDFSRCCTCSCVKAKHGHNIKYASDELKNDRDVVILAIANDNSRINHTHCATFRNCSSDLRGDIEIVLAGWTKSRICF